MPEYPDIELYRSALESRVVGRRLLAVRLASPFVLRSVEPPIRSVAELEVLAIERLGKRLVFALESELFLVIHLMVAGRFRWADPDSPIPKRIGLAAFDFETGALILTEAGSKKRASLHVVSGRAALGEHDPGGLELFGASSAAFREALTRTNHTVKRALTDPKILSGIGNAYSDEILHRARMSPFKQTAALTPEESEALRLACLAVLGEWRDRLIAEAGDAFPGKVTAFRPEMAVHGRFGKPCPECGAPVQRIVYANNEANYCVTCQTDGKVLADRALSRLLKKDWPRTLEELEMRRPRS